MTGLNITVVGTGYVGLVSGVCFASIGHNVTCVDSNIYKVQQLQQGEIPIYEPGLEKLVVENTAAGRLHFSSELPASLTDCNAVFIAVGTPTAADGISADLSSVYAVARSLAPHLTRHMVVVTKSTVPVSTNKAIEDIIYGLNPQAQFDICSNPEFLREGNAIGDFMQPDRIVIGVRHARAQEIMEKLYAPLTQNGAPLLVTTPESAELIKYASNAFLATKIAFINEVANVAEATGGDIQDIARGIGMDSRIGAKFLQAGPGYGGSCFPKDTRAFAHMAQQSHTPSPIIEAVIASNEQRKKEMSRRILSILGDANGKKIAVLGVTFKADTNDMREAVSLDIIPQLLLAGAEIHAYDPAADHHAHDLLPQAVYWHDDVEKTFYQADAVLLLTEWPEFREIDLARMRSAVKNPVLIDLRNFLYTDLVTGAGFSYFSIGRPARKPFASTHKMTVIKS